MLVLKYMEDKKLKYIIEDESHAEMQGEFDSFEDALTELKKRSTIPWDQEPNKCPCTNWRNCRRNYEIAEYNTANKPYWKEIERTSVLEISSSNVKWLI